MRLVKIDQLSVWERTQLAVIIGIIVLQQLVVSHHHHR